MDLLLGSSLKTVSMIDLWYLSKRDFDSLSSKGSALVFLYIFVSVFIIIIFSTRRLEKLIREFWLGRSGYDLVYHLVDCRKFYLLVRESSLGVCNLAMSNKALL